MALASLEEISDMTGILIITHYELGQSFISCVRHFFVDKSLNNFACVCVDKNDDPEERQAHAQVLINTLDDGSGVLILSDIFGATPSNIAMRLVKPNKVIAISGLNLPMLIRAISYSSKPLSELVDMVIEGAHEGIIKSLAEREV